MICVSAVCNKACLPSCLICAEVHAGHQDVVMSKTYFPSRTTRSKQFWNSLNRGLFLTLFTDLLTDLLQPGASVSSKSNRVKDRHELAWESLTQGEQRSRLLWRAVQQGESQVDGPEECPEAKCKSSRTSKEKKDQKKNRKSKVSEDPPSLRKCTRSQLQTTAQDCVCLVQTP